jgi:AbrB family looped-hinge helix DNA binding protein
LPGAGGLVKATAARAIALAARAPKDHLTFVLPWRLSMPADDGAFKTRLSTKGQVVLPKEIRRRRGWGPGVELVIEETPRGVLLRPARVFPETRIEDVAGMLHEPGMKAASIEEMDEAIAEEVRRLHALGRY